MSVHAEDFASITFVVFYIFSNAFPGHALKHFLLLVPFCQRMFPLTSPSFVVSNPVRAMYTSAIAIMNVNVVVPRNAPQRAATRVEEV